MIYLSLSTCGYTYRRRTTLVRLQEWKFWQFSGGKKWVSCVFSNWKKKKWLFFFLRLFNIFRLINFDQNFQKKYYSSGEWTNQKMHPRIRSAWRAFFWGDGVCGWESVRVRVCECVGEGVWVGVWVGVCACVMWERAGFYHKIGIKYFWRWCSPDLFVVWKSPPSHTHTHHPIRAKWVMSAFWGFQE
jgi:hypothetical protein